MAIAEPMGPATSNHTEAPNTTANAMRASPTLSASGFVFTGSPLPAGFLLAVFFAAVFSLVDFLPATSLSSSVSDVSCDARDALRFFTSRVTLPKPRAVTPKAAVKPAPTAETADPVRSPEVAAARREA